MAQHNDFGRGAEELAARLLTSRGWTIESRNWRWRHKEIDLICRRDRIVAFVEVRARRSRLRGHPLETITWTKRRDLQQAAQSWIGRSGRHGDAYRFDAVWILAEDGDLSRARIEHVEGAWTL
jgi:putative endonuclease